MLYINYVPISGKKIIKLLKKAGWVVVSQTGSHVKLKNGSEVTIVPVHGNKDLPKGTIKSIEKQTGEKLI
ncbi:MAG: type II toxin-antitoxin system HicA family toxin [Bdellovibrionales bacterium]|nr:type II toxin-antitoxin system HicA family toxin [Bdellovibrionales bacterium]NQZ17644.1 type II toxin-antitoxin system HicA family toxin [Bdellovibrionales bacterium]